MPRCFMCLEPLGFLVLKQKPVGEVDSAYKRQTALEAIVKHNISPLTAILSPQSGSLETRLLYQLRLVTSVSSAAAARIPVSFPPTSGVMNVSQY